jgi:hypothetical protein
MARSRYGCLIGFATNLFPGLWENWITHTWQNDGAQDETLSFYLFTFLSRPLYLFCPEPVLIN